MIIEKVLNNNVVTTVDPKTRKEMVIMGSGLAFKRKVGDEIDDSKIEKTFLLENKIENEKFIKLINEIPIEVVETSEKIIDLATKELNVKIDEHIHIALADHIAFAIKRVDSDMFIKNHLLFEIKRIYKEEYSFGKKAIEIINHAFNINLPDDEAGFIAMHFINMSLDETISDKINLTNIIRDVLNIIRYHFSIEFKEDDLSYDRLLTHLKFFAQRVITNKQSGSDEDAFFAIIKEKYTDVYNCVLKIKAHILKTYNYNIDNAEIVYLGLHIQRVIQTTKK
ncbi:MAG: BglG family transcription antiterminator LicT [Clostridiaceae bacterium]